MNNRDQKMESKPKLIERFNKMRKVFSITNNNEGSIKLFLSNRSFSKFYSGNDNGKIYIFRKETSFIQGCLLFFLNQD